MYIRANVMTIVRIYCKLIKTHICVLTVGTRILICAHRKTRSVCVCSRACETMPKKQIPSPLNLLKGNAQRQPRLYPKIEASQGDRYHHRNGFSVAMRGLAHRSLICLQCCHVNLRCDKGPPFPAATSMTMALGL